MKILAVVQARTGSTRLPGKVLMPLAGRPLLQRMVERVLAASTPSEVLVATTLDPADDRIANLADLMGVDCYRGHRIDLLDRHYAAGLSRQADAVVKIPSDCPLIDPGVIDRVIECYAGRARRADYVSNLHPPTYPDGNDVEVIGMAALERAWKNATEPFDREHTTPYIWTRPREFRLANVSWESGLDHSRTHRWTIDHPEDYEFMAAVYKELWTIRRPLFALADILSLLERRPDITAINAHLAGRTWLRDGVRTRPTHERRLPA
jgi:spore coat polysaccharide biosynthesis protein SpsF